MGCTGAQWTRLQRELKEVKQLNSLHNETLNSHEFKFNTTRLNRVQIIKDHKHKIFERSSLLGLLVRLQTDYLNTEIVADFNDWIALNNLTGRLVKRLRKAYLLSIGRQLLKVTNEDPLEVFGSEALKLIKNAPKTEFSDIGKLRIGNKIIVVTSGGNIEVKKYSI